jgi:hypothetical protein
LALVLTSKKEDSTLCEYFKYKLTTFPLSLFDSNCQLRNANKYELAKEIATQSNYNHEQEEIFVDQTRKEHIQFVKDGGWLLHRLPLSKCEKYSNILLSYCDYVIKNYGTRAKVVFNFYSSGPST